MNKEPLMLCPCCNKPVAASHFSCHAGARVGAISGKQKRRGDADYYRAIQAKAAATRKRNNAKRRKAGQPVL